MPLAHLLVRGEGHADVTVRDFARAQAHHGGEDLGDAGLVVGAQQRFAVGGDQGLPQHLVQDREHHRRQHFIADAQRDVAAAIVLDDLRIDVFAAEIRRGIQMGDKTDRRHRPCDVARPVPITQPCSLSDTRSKPSAIISCCNARASFNCPSVLGTCFTFALDWVSKET